MIREFSNIKCIYFTDKNFIPQTFDCPNLIIDDVVLNLTTNPNTNIEIISECIVDYCFSLFCNKSDISDFAENHLKYKRNNWKLLDFKEVKDSLKNDE